MISETVFSSKLNALQPQHSWGMTEMGGRRGEDTKNTNICEEFNKFGIKIIEYCGRIISLNPLNSPVD